MTTVRRLTSAAVAAMPAPRSAAPLSPAFAPDGRRLAFLWSEHGTNLLGLWCLDVQSGELREIAPAAQGYVDEGVVPLDVALVRERRRHMALGIQDFCWHPSRGEILLTRDGDAFVVDAATGVIRPLFSAPHPILAPGFSPDGRILVFVADGDLWSVGLDGGALVPRRLTQRPGPDVLNGAPTFVEQEELHRGTAYWWHPSGSSIVFQQSDEHEVADAWIPARDPSRWDRHKYPFSGGAMGSWRLGIMPSIGSDVAWLPTDERFHDTSLVHASFDPKGRFVVGLLRRDQRQLWMLARAIDDPAADWHALVEETSEPWVELLDAPKWSEDGARFAWRSSAAAEDVVSIRDTSGAEIDTLSTGNVRIDEILALDTTGSALWFTGREGEPEDRALYRQDLPPSRAAATRLGPATGWQAAQLSLKRGVWIDVQQSVDAPPQARIRDVGGHVVRDLPAAGPAALPDSLVVPEFLDLPDADGGRLRAALYRPPQLDEGRKHPLVVSVYAGPRAQSVRNTWSMTVDLRAQRFVQAGCLVLKVDSRGSAGRGRAFEAQIFRRVGAIDCADQAAAVTALVQEDVVHPERVGIYGWSYGGYVAAMCCLRYPDVFRVGFAGAPVIDWATYDTCYTERYLGTPRDNPEGYRAADVRTWVTDRSSPLLIAHGLRDENVLFAHSAKLIAALQAAGRPHEVLVLPEERHSPRLAHARTLIEERVFEFICRLVLRDG